MKSEEWFWVYNRKNTILFFFEKKKTRRIKYPKKTKNNSSLLTPHFLFGTRERKKKQENPSSLTCCAGCACMRPSVAPPKAEFRREINLYKYSLDFSRFSRFSGIFQIYLKIQILRKKFIKNRESRESRKNRESIYQVHIAAAPRGDLWRKW